MTADKKIIIVGAGIAGLSAGIYARRAGFSVTILERHNIPGGLSTGWQRNGYFFEGGMHWLTGSSEKLTLNRIWKETGALQANNPIFSKDPFYTLIDGDRQLHLYRSIDKLEQHFLDFAPEDKAAVKRLCSDIRLYRNVHMIVNDIPFLKAEHHTHPAVSELLAMTPAVTRLAALKKQSCSDYTAQFKNKNIRHLLMSVIGYRYNALSLVYTLASFSSGDCGYPEGGSITLTKNMADTFEKLGGTIKYRSNVEKVEVKDKKVTGVYINGSFIPADAVIVTADTRQAVDTMFAPPLNEKWTDKMRSTVISEQNMFLGFGVKADLKDLPRAVVFPLEKPFKAAGLEFNEIRINNYALYPCHAPENCTTLTCLLLGDSYSYWKAAKEDGSYKQKKHDLAQTLLEELYKFIPQIKDKVEVIDVATPMTYQRYCNSFEGSWMSVWSPGTQSFAFPEKSKSVQGLYFAGERMRMPGGLPIAVVSGRSAAQYLCRDNKVKFI